MKLTPEQQKERAAILADIEAICLRLTKLLAAPAEAKWPQIGDTYLCSESTGSIETYTWNGTKVSAARLSIGNVVHPSREAYLERHVEALKVHHELRSMLGRTAPPSGDGCQVWGILSNDGGNSFKSVNYLSIVTATIALGGVWFSSKESCDNAIEAIGQDRLSVLYGDFLQTPI